MGQIEEVSTQNGVASFGTLAFSSCNNSNSIFGNSILSNTGADGFDIDIGTHKIVAARMMTLTPEQAGQFYVIHKDRPFYGELVDYMVSGPVLVSALEGPDAVAMNRKLMGATDPKKADAGTIRADFADSINANAVHGSDSLENAKQEIKFFFPELA